MSNRFKPEQLITLIISNSKELMREPAVLFWGIIFPLLMALGLGLAFTQKSETYNKIAVIEDNQKAAGPIESFLDKHGVKIIRDNSVEYKLTLKNKKLGNSVYTFQKMDWKEANILLKKGEINLFVDDSGGTIKYHFDPAAPDAQLNYLKLARIFANRSMQLQSSENIKPLTVTGTRYIDFFVPGLISMGILMSSVWGVGYSLIERRSKKLLRRMVATPMKKSHFLISFMTVRTAMNFIEAFLLFIFSNLVFGITIQGSIPALLLVFIAGNINFAGLAILMGSRTDNPEVGNGIISAVTTPMFVLSGIFFSYHHFPGWTLPFIKILPLTMLADALRSIFIEGAGYQQIALPFLIITGMGLFFFLVGLKTFKWY